MAITSLPNHRRNSNLGDLLRQPDCWSWTYDCQIWFQSSESAAWSIAIWKPHSSTSNPKDGRSSAASHNPSDNFTPWPSWALHQASCWVWTFFHHSEIRTSITSSTSAFSTFSTFSAFSLSCALPQQPKFVESFNLLNFNQIQWTKHSFGKIQWHNRSQRCLYLQEIQ